MFGLELWFIFAVLSALIGGFGNFGNKISAARGYDSATIMIMSSLITALIFWPLAFYFESPLSSSLLFVGIIVLSGFIGSFSSIIKIQALHYIDSAIFLPLYKVASPLVVIGFGLLFFDEAFTPLEWFGLLLSLLIPFMLISRVEHTRQNNLQLGLWLVLIASIFGAIAAGVQKLGTDISNTTLTITALAMSGVLIGSCAQQLWHKGGNTFATIREHSYRGPIAVALLRSIFAGAGFYLTILAYEFGGPLGIVYTIISLYILVPIVLAIIFYGEHWNLRKATAIVLSIVALALLH